MRSPDEHAFDGPGRMLPPDFTLRQLSYLVAAAEAGTVAGAAKRMHVSSSAMSDAISELERVIGEPLCIRRRSRGLVLTAAGEAVVTRARDILESTSDLARVVRSGGDELSGPLTIACYPTLAPTVLPPILHDFAELHPFIELSVVEATHDQLEGKLESGAIDVAFTYDLVVPGTPNRRELYRRPPYAILPAGHRLAARGRVDLRELAEEDFILYDAPPSSVSTMSMFASRGVHPRVRYRTSSFEAVRTLVGRGLGYSVLVQRPRITVTYEGLPVGMVGIEPPVGEVAVDVIWPSRRQLPERTRALVDFATRVDWLGADRRGG